MHSMRAQIPNMNDKGSIINAASLAGYRGFAKNAAYTATKVRPPSRLQASMDPCPDIPSTASLASPARRPRRSVTAASV